MEMAPESSLPETLQGFIAATNLFMEKPETTWTWQAIMTSGGFGGQEFVPPNERPMSTIEMLPDVQKELQSLPSVNAFLYPEPALPTAGQFDLEVVVTTSDPAQKMLPTALSVVQKARESGLFLFFETNLRKNSWMRVR